MVGRHHRISPSGLAAWRLLSASQILAHVSVWQLSKEIKSNHRCSCYATRGGGNWSTMLNTEQLGGGVAAHFQLPETLLPSSASVGGKLAERWIGIDGNQKWQCSKLFRQLQCSISVHEGHSDITTGAVTKGKMAKGFGSLFEIFINEKYRFLRMRSLRLSVLNVSQSLQHIFLVCSQSGSFSYKLAKFSALFQSLRVRVCNRVLCWVIDIMVPFPIPICCPSDGCRRPSILMAKIVNGTRIGISKLGGWMNDEL